MSAGFALRSLRVANNPAITHIETVSANTTARLAPDIYVGIFPMSRVSLYSTAASPAPGTNPITERIIDSCTIVHTKKPSPNPIALSVAY